MIIILRWTVGIKSKIIGYEKLEKGKAYIIVGKHESTWDTLIMHTFMKPAPVFILKKELLFVPFFGWCLATASKIAIDRKAGASALKQVLKEGKEYIEEGHNIIIFPQGTRVPPEAKTKEYPYKTGFIGLIRELGADIVPMALNSGKLWRKKQFLKYSGTITMEFMDPIKFEDIKKMSKEELLTKLENIIEKKCEELNKL
ncbi:MAG TPA: lysophospholipid acyltransferase family protein [Rickettsiales bacterium]|nr:lysophospholipid acyltransferase family protein [Rickettsiales bacterium]